jgi:hypothetical protein
MARVQNTSQKGKQTSNKPQAKQPVNPKSKVELAKTNPKREPTKNEIMFFRIGMIVIALTMIIGTVVILIRYFMNEEAEKGVFDDYIHLTAENFQILTADDGFGSFGQRDFYQGVVGYEDLNEKLASNDIMYVYFYRSSDVNEETVEVIKAIEDFDEYAFFLVDIDQNPNLFQTPGIEYLGLSSTSNHMLLTFNYNPVNTEDDPFILWTTTSNILIDLGKL